MKEKIDSNSMSLKWEQNGELAHKDLSELIERLKNVESEHTSSELSRFCLLYTSPSPRDTRSSRMPSSA